MTQSVSDSALLDPPVVGNVADLQAGEILLPSFVSKRPDGLFVDPAAVETGDHFLRFVDRVLAVGAYFPGLDYAVFSRLLYQGTPGSTSGPLRLAADLQPFPPPRRALYKSVKVSADGEAAEYMFEPVYLEIEETMEAGESQIRSEPTKLDFDEFVAHLWSNGIRAGIDEKAVRRIIDKGDTERLEVARATRPAPGRDATLEEKSKALHRDNSPKTLANGHIDLGQFSNRYPQVNEGEVLLQKLPRKLGEPGRALSGEVIEPDMPGDFQLADLAGPGTRVELRADGEYIVAAMTGFLNLDPDSNRMEVTEKIVSRDGVSMRTTGNLVLAGEDYEEFGEVQERRVVEGKNMTFHANVYGILLSRGGVIGIDATLSGGKASSPGGEVVIAGRASASMVEAPNGKVKIKHAEGCTICASEVWIEHAVNCQIVAEHAEIGTAEGCAIAAKSVNIAIASERKNVETVVSMLVPDFSEQEEQARQIAKSLAGKQAELQQFQDRMKAAREQKDFANFLALQAKIKKGEIKLAPAQEAGLHKAAAQFAPAMQDLRTFSANIHVLQDAVAELTRRAQALEQGKTAQGQGIRCLIESVTGDTIVHVRHYDLAESILGEKQLPSLLAQLRTLGESNERLFSGGSDRFGWQYGVESGPGEDAGRVT